MVNGEGSGIRCFVYGQRGMAIDGHRRWVAAAVSRLLLLVAEVRAGRSGAGRTGGRAGGAEGVGKENPIFRQRRGRPSRYLLAL